MRLSELMAGLSHEKHGPPVDPEVLSVTHDSRQVAQGALFVAFPGLVHDGRRFVGEASGQGAVAAIGPAPPPLPLTIPYLEVAHVRNTAGLVAARLAGDPSSGLLMVGITGTSGKTTTSLLVDRILADLFPKTGLFGTLVYRGAGGEGSAVPASRTTPEATELQPRLRGLLADGGGAAVLECSSHALALDRLAGCSFDAALFLNLTRDHFDFHRGFEDYFEAKARLFEMLKPGGRAVVNVDDEWGRKLRERLPKERVVSFSIQGPGASPALPGADVAGTMLPSEGLHLSVVLRATNERFEIFSPLLGRANAENLLAAFATAVALGLSPSRAARALGEVRVVPGRLEEIPNPLGLLVLVDYAHKPAALEGVLKTLRPLAKGRRGRLLLLFGCGGDRDRGKRPEMGQIAAEKADLTVLTSDNSRSEKPESILEEIRAGFGGGEPAPITLADRRMAIREVLRLARTGDVVLLAGKGHETTQETAGRKEPFDDRVVAREEIAALAASMTNVCEPPVPTKGVS